MLSSTRRLLPSTSSLTSNNCSIASRATSLMFSRGMTILSKESAAEFKKEVRVSMYHPVCWWNLCHIQPLNITILLLLFSFTELQCPHGQDASTSLPPRNNLLLPHLRPRLHYHPRNRLRPLLRRCRSRRPRNNRWEWCRSLPNVGYWQFWIGTFFWSKICSGVSDSVSLFGGVAAFGVG